MRKIIYTTNAIESLNYQLRKIIRNRGQFSNDTAVVKLRVTVTDPQVCPVCLTETEAGLANAASTCARSPTLVPHHQRSVATPSRAARLLRTSHA